MPGESADQKFARERERALIQLVSLRAMVSDPRTVPGEAAAAQARITAMMSKYGITGPSLGFDDLIAKGNAVRAKKAKERAAAAEAYRREHARMKDHNGMTATDREWAKRDPVGYAAAHDTRTAQEKQRDMQDSFGGGQRRRRPMTNDPWVKRCDKPVTFYDPGGIARDRNRHRVKCDRCHVVLDPGEGCVTVLGVFCCEMKPGPRNKRPERE